MSNQLVRVNLELTCRQHNFPGQGQVARRKSQSPKTQSQVARRHSQVSIGPPIVATQATLKGTGPKFSPLRVCSLSTLSNHSNSVYTSALSSLNRNAENQSVKAQKSSQGYSTGDVF